MAASTFFDEWSTPSGAESKSEENERGQRKAEEQRFRRMLLRIFSHSGVIGF